MLNPSCAYTKPALTLALEHNNPVFPAAHCTRPNNAVTDRQLETAGSEHPQEEAGTGERIKHPSSFCLPYSNIYTADHMSCTLSTNSFYLRF